MKAIHSTSIGQFHASFVFVEELPGGPPILTRMRLTSSSLGRIGIVTVAASLTNLPIPSVDQDLGLLIDGDLRRRFSRLGLRLMNARRSAVARTLDGPTALVRDDVLVLSHD